MKTEYPKIWKPTSAGKLFTGSEDWEFQLDTTEFLLRFESKETKGHIQNLETLSIISGYFWSTIEFPISTKKTVLLDGIPNQHGQALHADVQLAIKRFKFEAKKKALIESNIKALQNFLPTIYEWSKDTRKFIDQQVKSKGWLSNETFKRLFNSRPISDIDFGLVEIKSHLNQLKPNELDAVIFWQTNPESIYKDTNDKQLRNALVENKVFFDTIEKSPLTKEQIEAVVCFDNRTLLVASAGSGKTSTMVAKCGYAMKQGYFRPESILLLAFNNDAAKELQKRVHQRFAKHSLPSQDLSIKTFHAFGLEVIGKALDKRPSIPHWLESGKDIATMMEIVDDLKDSNLSFRVQWDLFRIVFSQDLPKFGKEADSPDSWDQKKQSKGFWTLNNEVVKSRGELIIANWLFYNGVNYQYEAPYKHETANAEYSQYTPDFYFPEIDVYLEHWALDENGEPPADFTHYKQDMAWKKALHAQHNTRLLETTMAELWSGKAFDSLTKSLTKLGIKLDPNPDRKAPGRKPIENARLIRTFRSFLTHVKSNRLTIETLKKHLETGILGDFQYRHRMFLMLFESIWLAWDNKLKSEQSIDFDDMINLATDLIEQERWENPYELIMVDEFQDLSQSRTRLLHALLSKPDQYLFAVGDDWQSINRFAGSHLGVMTDFEAIFGESTILKLESTFRCPQSLCDISSQFIQKNPNQLKKNVQSKVDNVVEPVTIYRVPDDSHIQSVIEKKLREISASVKEDNRKSSVFILGRYNHDEAYVPKKFNDNNLAVKFITVHSSKGLEADHIIIPKLSAETLGFPSQIEDDPVLQLAMPAGDRFKFSEERRLFYVALTRARQSVTLITIEKRESSFILELVDDTKFVVHDIAGEKQSLEVCPKCQNAFITEKESRYGRFFSCSAYPMCDYKPPKNSKYK